MTDTSNVSSQHTAKSDAERSTPARKRKCEAASADARVVIPKGTALLVRKSVATPKLANAIASNANKRSQDGAGTMYSPLRIVFNVLAWTSTPAVVHFRP